MVEITRTVEFTTETSSPASGPSHTPIFSWLQLDFCILEDEEGLVVLYAEIEAATPPLHDIKFTNMYLAAFVGRFALNRVEDTKSLKEMTGMSVGEATHRASALMLRVSSYCFPQIVSSQLSQILAFSLFSSAHTFLHVEVGFYHRGGVSKI